MQIPTEPINQSRPISAPVTERETWSWPGLVVLPASIAGYVVGIVLIAQRGAAAITIGIVLLVLATAGVAGLTAITPGQVRVIQLFGGYQGTVRKTGLRWVNPFSVRRKVSVRIRNKETPTVKVNDADGNPIEIAAVVVWQVRDSARATYGVEGTRDIMSPRDHTDEVAAQLAVEIAARVVPAGVDIVEARITRLSYAPEIAQVMLQRQQASAVVAARSRIVEGAVGMVQMALDKLADQDVVELDEERKAAMVSNLLVVLCGDRGTQPIVNAGSLYH